MDTGVSVSKPGGLYFHMVFSYLVAIPAKMEIPELDMGLTQLSQCCQIIISAPYIHQEKVNPT